MGTLAGLAVIGGVVFVVVHGQQEDAEPLALLEGISIWPTVYLRLVAFFYLSGLSS